MLTPEQKSLVKDIASEVPSMVSNLSKRISADESKALIDWANESVIVEFLEASAWDHWTASFKLKQTLQWRKEYGVLEAKKTVVPNLVPGLETTYA
ncbi:UNVERIFIED_CONTAM: hypothetical protein HDU68_000783, partial [Siphonaria sp. JEL0065]